MNYSVKGLKHNYCCDPSRGLTAYLTMFLRKKGFGSFFRCPYEESIYAIFRKVRFSAKADVFAPNLLSWIVLDVG